MISQRHTLLRSYVAHPDSALPLFIANLCTHLNSGGLPQRSLTNWRQGPTCPGLLDFASSRRLFTSEIKCVQRLAINRGRTPSGHFSHSSWVTYHLLLTPYSLLLTTSLLTTHRNKYFLSFFSPFAEKTLTNFNILGTCFGKSQGTSERGEYS